MVVGIWVLNVFAAVWAGVGLKLAGAPRRILVVPVIVSAVLGSICARAVPESVAASDDGAHVGRVVGLWSGVEAVLISATFLCYGARAALVSFRRRWG